MTRPGGTFGGMEIGVECDRMGIFYRNSWDKQKYKYTHIYRIIYIYDIIT